MLQYDTEMVSLRLVEESRLEAICTNIQFGDAIEIEWQSTLLVELKCWDSPRFFYYDLCWLLKFKYLNGFLIFGSGDDVPFQLQARIHFVFKPSNSK
jgi:hypothetical protein